MASASAMAPAWTSRGPSIVYQHLRFSFNVLLGVMTTMLLQHLAYRFSAPFLREASSGVGDNAMVKLSAILRPHRTAATNRPSDIFLESAFQSGFYLLTSHRMFRSASDADFEAIGREPEGLHLPAHPPAAALPLPEQTVIRRDEPPIYQHLREQNSLQRQTETAYGASPNDAIADGRVVRDPVTDGAEDAEVAISVKSEEVPDQAGGAAGNPDFLTTHSTDQAFSGDISRQLLSDASGDMTVEASGLPASRRVPTSPKYFLSAMVYNRVFRGDRLNFSSFEIWQVSLRTCSSCNISYTPLHFPYNFPPSLPPLPPHPHTRC
ncbi:unnamed protein product [Closterium sp. NIES-54]